MAAESVDYLSQDRDDAYEFVRRTLVRIGYALLSRPGKGSVRRYLAKTTGLSRAQVTRLIGQHRGRPFERICTAADIRLLAEVDEIGKQMCGPGPPARCCGALGSNNRYTDAWGWPGMTRNSSRAASL